MKGLERSSSYKKSGIVADLFIQKEKGRAGLRVLRADCVKGLGMSGDLHAKGGERQITLLDLNLKYWMLKQEQKGLCFDKFKENITITGLDFDDIKPGDKLGVGRVELQITDWKKKCYPKECSIFPKVNPCPFPKGCLFASVLCSGSIYKGDEVISNTP